MYPNAAVPPLPAPQVAKQFTDDYMNERATYLSKFLTSCLKNEIIKQDYLFEQFLDNSDSAEYKKTFAKISKAVSEITHLSGIVSYPGDETLLVQCPDDNRIEEANTQTKKLTSFLKNYVTQKQRFHRLSKVLEDDLASVANTLGNMKDCSKTLLALEIQFDENFGGGVNSKWTELYENLSSNLIFWSQTLK